MGRITDKGYELTTQNEYFEQERAAYLAIDPNWNLDTSTIDFLKIAKDAELFSYVDEMIKASYDARDPNLAKGYNLDVLCALTGFTRSPGTATTVELTLSGVPGTIVPINTSFKDIKNHTFISTATVTIASDGVATVQAICTEKGAIPINVGEVNQISVVIGGLQSVTNRTVGKTGTNKDSDAVTRLKRNRSVGASSANQADSFYSSIYAVENVRDARVYENRTGSANVDPVKNPYGLPAHTVAIVVDGGDDDEVARAIFDKLTVGVNMHAVGTEVSKDVRSLKYPAHIEHITYSRPLEVPITLTITVQDVNNNCPDQLALQEIVRQAYIDYAEGKLIEDGQGFMAKGYSIGESVPYAQMFTPINKVLGNYYGAYAFDITLNGGKENVSVPFNKIAKFEKERITVSVNKGA